MAKTANDYTYVKDAAGVYVPASVAKADLGPKHIGKHKKLNGEIIEYAYRLPLDENRCEMSGSNTAGGNMWESHEFGC